MKKHAHKGFTLLEVMVALMIFSLIGIAGIQLIRGSLKSSEQLREKSADFAQIQRSFILLEQDFGQAVARKKQQTVGSDLPAEMMGQRLSEGFSEVTVLRGNKFNPGGYLPRSSLEWVKWYVADGKLMRGHAVFTEDSSEMRRFRDDVILDGVRAFRVRFADKEGWHENWSAPDTLPKAVSVNIVSAGMGTLHRVILVPGA